MPELPLIGPSNPGISPVPIVRPQNVAGETIARAGGQMIDDATKLFWMQNMARRDEANAFMDNKMGMLQQAHDGIMAAAADRGLTGQAYSDFYNNQIQATRDQLMQGVPKGFMRDLLQGAMNKQVASSSGEVLKMATAQALKKAENDTIIQIKNTADQIPYMDPASAKQRQIDIHNLIHTMHGWDDTQKQQWDGYFAGKVALANQNKLIDDAPGHALSALLSPDWIKNNPEIAAIGDPAVVRQQLINRASSTIKDGSRQMQAFVAQQQQQDFNTLMNLRTSGKPISDATLDNMPSLSTGVKRMFKPSYHPEPLGDPGALQNYLDRANDVTSQSDGNMLQMEAIAGRRLNSDQMKELNKKIAATVQLNGTQVGAIKRQALTDLRDRYNPPARHLIETPNTKFQRELAGDAQKEIQDMPPNLSAEEAREYVQKVQDKYDKIRDQTLHPKPKPVPAPIMTAPKSGTVSDWAAAIRGSGWSPPTH